MATTISVKFPEGYGDFALKSTDGIGCYFPRSILSLMSPVFGDMFNIAQESNTWRPTGAQIEMEERGEIVELFLTHLDPRLLKPPMDIETIQGLLAMAHKYQVDAIVRWFEHEVVMQHSNQATLATTSSFLTTQPLLVLALASQFDLIQTTKIALRELARCSYNLLTTVPSSLSLKLYLLVLKIRDERIKRYQGRINTLAEHHISAEYDIWGRRELVEDDLETQACIRCTTNRAKWISGMERAVQRSPNWAIFIDAYEDSTMCTVCNLHWPTHFRDQVDIWSETARYEEDSLPDLPIET